VEPRRDERPPLRFAAFPPAKVDAKPAAKSASIAADLANVHVTVLMSPEQRAAMANNGFVVSPGGIKEFYELYERVRYDYVPVFVTTDSLLHVYHLMFDKLLRRIEGSELAPRLERLDRELLDRSLEQAEQVKGGPLEDAALRNAAYFAVALKLLNSTFALPDKLRSLAEKDLKSIGEHKSIGPSTVFPGLIEGEDWTQYVPRGHYTKSEALKSYFVAMMWHGRMTFRVSDPTELRQAALLLIALETRPEGKEAALDLWSSIYAPTVFFAGESDDLTPFECRDALAAAAGGKRSAKGIDESVLERFKKEMMNLRPPQVLSLVITKEDEVDASTKGMRFFGQRLVPDAVVFRRLIDRSVPDRMLPKALDLFAALGSDRALSHVGADASNPAYDANMKKLRAMFGDMHEDRFTENLYVAWIHSLRPLLDPVPKSYPAFMQSPAWLDKSLTSALGSWTELNHDTILYAKPVYAEMGGGGLPPPTPKPPTGYVEPAPLVFARLASLAKMTEQGLLERKLISAEDGAAVTKLADLATELKALAEKELIGAALSEKEAELLRYYGANIESLTFAASNEGDLGDQAEPEGGDAVQAAVVADVANDPQSSRVLEEGVGRVYEILAAVPVEGRLVVAKGGVFSHYEFVEPMSGRLTDEAWRKRLDEGKAPKMAPWTTSYIVDKTVAQGPAEVVRAFTERMVDALWYTDSSYSTDMGLTTLARTIQAPYQGAKTLLADPALGQLEKQIAELKKVKHFVGMTREHIEMLSYDFQDETHCTVSTRERWSDELLSGDPQDDSGREPDSLAKRGPYEQAATYTLSKKDGAWIISHIVRRPEAPRWKPLK
jgi:hypothetical protein